MLSIDIVVRDAHGPAGELRDRFDDFLPNMVSAGGLLLAGIVLGLVASILVARLLRRAASQLTPDDPSAPTAELDAELRRSSLDATTIRIVSRVTFLLVFIVFVAAAAEALQLPLVSDWLLGFANYLPRVLAAMVIVLLGLLLGAVANRVSTRAARTANLEYADTVGRAAQFAIFGVSLIIAVDELGIAAGFLITTASIILAAMLGALALSFGLGAQRAVSNIVATHYLARSYQPGQRVRIAEYEGEIVEIGPTAVVLDSPGGRIRIPARDFEDQASTLLGG